ncbi:MAG TPA: His/Gly/Thr/Pro-type tRNA ligase C-terminal domain-containing protein, partial [Tepidiformaceae bacterium]|nr:His/Gly/Thr/Pro-type tRNA ligase C-terminal domain-containing protein [Tepidiformaceae bacterium]
NGITFDPAPLAQVFIVHQATGAGGKVFALAAELRRAGIAAVVGESGKSMKAQMRAANAGRARFAIIIGDDELAAGTAVLKDLASEGGEQATLALAELPLVLGDRLRA